LNAAQRNRHAALLKATGYEDGPALTVQSTDGEIPHGRELSFAWLAGTVMTGLTSVLLMGAVLYVSFEGQDTFSTAYEALQIGTGPALPPTDLLVKTSRARPITQTRSELETIEASIRETVDGRDMIKKQPFSRLRATLATAATSLSDNVPAYDPVAMIAASQPMSSSGTPELVNTDIYGAEVEGEVAVRLASLPMTLVPPRSINDQGAADFVRTVVEGSYFEQDPSALAYAPANEAVHDLNPLPATGNAITGVAENVTVLPKTTLAEDSGLGRTERILTVREPSRLEEVLKKNGFTAMMVSAITNTLHNVYPSVTLPTGARLRILFGPSRASDTLIPYRMSIYIHDNGTNADRHAATVALTDKGQYVLGLAPAEITFPEEDTEEVNVANLPSIYRSIWETGRKHDMPDDVIKRIVGMFAYDIDLNKKITAGDTIEMLQTPPDATGRQELLYVGLKLGGTEREFFRFQNDDGVVSYFDPDGGTGKRFLTRRPLQGGGVVRSSFGWRVHPIFHTRKLHTGVDLASKTGTPIYAAGDGVVEKAQWESGYGKYVEIKHVNGFETGYGHMSRISEDMKPGVKVRQGQVIGYVGSTGNSTGPHLHFEIIINGSFVDPLSVKLPRDKTLPPQFERQFAQTVTQIRDLMQRDPSPMTIASN